MAACLSGSPQTSLTTSRYFFSSIELSPKCVSRYNTLQLLRRANTKEREPQPMMSNERYQGRILTCPAFGPDFIFSAGEEELYATRNLTNNPRPCPHCRAR